MRMRKRANLDKRMERCADYLIEEPETLRGQWQETFPGHGKLYVELGCGKGRFTADTAETIPEILYIAVEKVPDAMILAMEKIDRRGLTNVRFIDADAKLLNTMFAPGEADRIYINFCDPWPKSRDAKLRLTSPGFLRVSADVLKQGGEIHFKTDNTPVMTDYEAKFYEQGMKINRLVATKTAETKTTAAGAVPRLRNASLTDARGYEESQEANRRNEQ